VRARDYSLNASGLREYGDSGRLVGNPSLTGLGKSSPSTDRTSPMSQLIDRQAQPG